MESREYKDAKVLQLWHKLSLYTSYKKEIIELEAQLKELKKKFFDIGSPKAIQYDKEVFSSGKETSSLLNEVLSKEKRIEQDILYAKAHMKEIETLCHLCSKDVQVIIQYKFFDDHSWEDCENKFFKTRRTMARDIKKQLESFIHGVSE